MRIGCFLGVLVLGPSARAVLPAGPMAVVMVMRAMETVEH
jgi:hypothetical protein